MGMWKAAMPCRRLHTEQVGEGFCLDEKACLKQTVMVLSKEGVGGWGKDLVCSPHQCGYAHAEGRGCAGSHTAAQLAQQPCLLEFSG